MVCLSPCGMTDSTNNKNAFQWDTYHPFVDRIPPCTVRGGVSQHALGREVSAWGCLTEGSVCLGGVCLGGCLPRGVSA